MPSITFNETTQRYELVYTESEGGIHPEPTNTVLTEDVGEATPANCPCEACKTLRMDPTSKLKRGTLHNYSFKPRVWNRLSVPNDADDFYFGVELETDNYIGDTEYAGSRKRSPFDNRQAIDMRRPKRLWIAKSDSSVSGPEFVSHPATLAYWKAKEADLGEMFKMLVHAGFRSHDNDKCGMHINISRNAFTDSEHLYRFLTLLYINPSWVLRMSQRTASSATRWAPVNGPMQAEEQRRSIAERAFTSGAWYRTTDKYSALNIPASTEGRMEFRLPRGTLRLDRFLKNLEWTHGMLAFSKDNAEPKPSDFMDFALADSRYPNLGAFITERKDRLVRSAAATT